jgi:hypothetical protein
MRRILKPASAGILTILILEMLLRLFAFALPPQVWGYIQQDALMRGPSNLVYENPLRGVGHTFRPNIAYHELDAFMLNDPHNYGQQDLFDPDKLPKDIIKTPFYTDRNGFINREPIQDHYTFVTVADSFGGYSSPVRWQEFLGADYYDLSVSSWSFPHYAAALEQFGYSKQPEKVIILLYAGNDITGVKPYMDTLESGVGEPRFPAFSGLLLAAILEYALYPLRGGGDTLPVQVNGRATGLGLSLQVGS